MNKWLVALLLGFFSSPLLAANPVVIPTLTTHLIGYLAVGLFFIGYVMVVIEGITALKKSIPMMLVAGLIWILIAAVHALYGDTIQVAKELKQTLLDYSELLLFLIVSITYLNAMEDRYVFESVRAWLINRGYGYRQLFWITGLMAFFISSVNNNMTTAMLMIAVISAVGKDSPRFIVLSCISTVVAVNAGGAFSPFGGLSTLIVWQQNKAEFLQFLHLFVPSLINFLLPALCINFAIPKGHPQPLTESFPLRRGARSIIVLYLATVLTSVLLYSFWELPPVFGMMLGLTYLQVFSYYLQKTQNKEEFFERRRNNDAAPRVRDPAFDVFHKIEKLEWDTLLFFYGVMLSVAGLKYIGYIDIVAGIFYGSTITPTIANTLVGVISAFIDNTTVMFAVLSMNPDLSLGQWLLATLTASAGGSLLSFGSAAGVALMGQTKGLYNFLEHLRWTPAIALGFAGSIAAHLWLNQHLF